MPLQLRSRLIGAIMSNGDTPSDRAWRFFRRALLAALLGVGAAPVTAQAFQLPPIVEPPSQEHHVGKVIFVELVTPDLAASEQFYAGLFGWTFRDLAAGSTQYAEASLDGRPVAGLFHKALPPGEHRAPGWLGFFALVQFKPGAAERDRASRAGLI
jgi:uncharacterized protein